ncbi:MAG: S41 family peptidase [Anaerolineae bacterium]|nr:S41 family peptidase [Anaerolineae bacterium]MCI0610745.1 S41 family peptidase [Anaerolineae bacterium]
MKIKRIVFGFLILSLLACNYVTQMILPPTPTPTPTLTPTASPTPTPTPLVPAFIPPECASTPLATIPPETAFAQPTLESEVNADISQGDQLKVLEELAKIVQDVYVYPDYNGKDWNEIQSRYKARIEAGLDTESFYREMQAMIEELQDEHSFFLSPLEVKQTEAELRGEAEFVGVGIYSLPDTERQRLVVISTFPGSPAEHGGIGPHDSILLVDGAPLELETGNRLRGPACSAVVVTVQSPGEAPREVMLVRQAIQGGLDIEARLAPTIDGSKIGYIFIPTFFDETIPPQIENALNEFGQLDGLILDVRLNGGGSSSVVDPILEHFVTGMLGRFVSRADSRPMNVDANPIHNSQTVPIVVVVSQDTVSFGEIFAGVLRDSRGAKIVGETSLGNVEVLHGYDFDDGSQVWIASETFFPEQSDENWEQTGIVPDVTAFAEWDTFYFETDPSVAAAITLLGHK